MKQLRTIVWMAGLGLLVSGASARAEGARVALLPVVVHASDQQDDLRKGLGDMLAARLNQQRGISIVRLDDPAQATTDLGKAVAAAGAAGAQYVVFGSFTRFGDGASLDLECAKVIQLVVHRYRPDAVPAAFFGTVEIPTSTYVGQ